jgi:hypothetical protein
MITSGRTVMGSGMKQPPRMVVDFPGAQTSSQRTALFEPHVYGQRYLAFRVSLQEFTDSVSLLRDLVVASTFPTFPQEIS